MSGLLTLEDGLHVAIMQSCETALPPELAGYLLHGERGTLRAGRDGATLHRPGAEPLALAYPAHPLSDYAQEIAAFMDYVQRDIAGPTTGASERRSVAVVQAGYESARHGRPVVLRERFGVL